MVTEVPQGFIAVKQRSRNNIGGVEVRIAVREIRRYTVNSDGYTAVYVVDRECPLEVMESPAVIDRMIVASQGDAR